MRFFLFPGQGSQQPGMGKDFFAQSAAARAVFEEARALSPDSLLETLFEGNAEALTPTRVAQPALLIVETAISRHLASVGIHPAGCAGHSLGEIPALVATGVCSFPDALRLVFERARLMSENVPEGGMAAVLGLKPEEIEAVLPEGVQVANYNGPGQTIISGKSAPLELAMAAIKEAGAKRVLPLKVSGPFHSECMRPAVIEYVKVLDTIPFQSPKSRFISSVSGREESDPDRIRELLGQQLVSPVRWTQVMSAIGSVPALEVGPGSVLSGLARRMDGAPKVSGAGAMGDIAALPAEE